MLMGCDPKVLCRAYRYDSLVCYVHQRTVRQIGRSALLLLALTEPPPCLVSSHLAFVLVRRSLVHLDGEGVPKACHVWDNSWVAM